MPSPVNSARARLAARLVVEVPRVMSSRSSAAPSGSRRRTAPFTSTVSMNASISAGSRWPSTYGNAMQVAVSSSARSGSPEATPSHSLDSTSRTIASASAWLMSPPWPAAAGLVLAGLVLAWPALAWLAGARRRDLFLLLTASSYDSHPTELGVQGVDQGPERDVHRFRQPAPARGLQRGDAVARGSPHPYPVDQRRVLQTVTRQPRGDHLERLGRHLGMFLVAGRGREHAGRVAPGVGQRVGPVGGGKRP